MCVGARRCVFVCCVCVGVSFGGAASSVCVCDYASVSWSFCEFFYKLHVIQHMHVKKHVAP